MHQIFKTIYYASMVHKLYGNCYRIVNILTIETRLSTYNLLLKVAKTEIIIFHSFFRFSNLIEIKKL